MKQSKAPCETRQPHPALPAECLSFRAATPDDTAFLFEVYAGTRMDELDAVAWDENQKLAFFKMQFDARQRQYREVYRHADCSIILKDDQPIGTILVDRNDREIRLVDISILPEHRNAGVGTQLVVKLLEDATVAALPVNLHVLKTSDAVRFYERLGFSNIEEDGAYLKMIWAD